MQENGETVLNEELNDGGNGTEQSVNKVMNIFGAAGSPDTYDEQNFKKPMMNTMKFDKRESEPLTFLFVQEESSHSKCQLSHKQSETMQ